MLFDDLIPAGPASSAEPKGDRAGPGATGLFDDLVPAGATMGQAFGRGIDLMQGMLYGGVEAVGEAVGSESVAEWGRAGRERNVEEAAQYPQRKSVFDVGSVGDAVDYGADLVAEQAPMMAPPLAGAAVGAAAGGMMAGPPGAVVGGILGAAAPSFVMGTGEVQGAIKEKDPDAVAPGYALTGGAAIAALDTVLPGKIGSRIARSFGIGPAELVAEHVVKRIATEGGKAMVTEGITEAVQEVIAEATAAQATGQALDENWWKNAVEAGVAGAIIGGGVGGATAALPQGKATPAPSQGETVGETPAVDLDPDPERLDSPYVTPEDRASPIPTADIDDGKKIVADVLGETPAGEPAAVPEAGAPQIDIPAPVRAVLRKAGNTDEDIDIMSTAERRAELFAAFEAGVVPTPEEIDAAGTYAAPQAQAPAQPGGLTKEGVFGPRVGASADLSRVGEISGDAIIGFDDQNGRVRLIDGTEIPVTNGGGVIWGPGRSMIDPAAVKEFKNASGTQWVPVKHAQPAAPQGTAGTGVQPSPAAPQPEAAPRPDLEPLRRVLGRPIDDEWVSFSPESGTLAVPRSEMPQIRTIHRGAMVNFLNARGVAHREQDIPARDLKPTQGEFSRKKVRKAQEFEGSDRKILVSSDGYVLDGHHQWVAKLADNGDVGAIVLDAPIRDLISLTREFPSSTFAKGAEAGAVEAGAAGRPQAVLPQAAPTGTETVDLAPRPTLVRQRRAPAGKGIIGFIRSLGGLKPDAELDVMELRRARPGTISKKGLDLDSMREAAAEAGYFDHLYGTPERAMQMSTPRDLLDLIDGELRGDVALDAQDRAESDPLAMTPAQQWEQEEALSAARGQIDEIQDEHQVQIPDDIRARAELYIATGEETDPELAIERAAIMLENDERGTNDVVEPLDIPGWMDDEIQQSGTSRARPGTGPGRGEADRPGEGGKTATTGAHQKGARADGTESRDQEDARLTRAEKKTMGGQAKRPARESSYGKSNKIFTEEAAEKARRILKEKLRSQLNAGLDPELVQAGITLAGYHIEAGARSFSAYSKAMIDDLGEGVRPYLRSWYEGVRHYPGFNAEGMTPAAEIDAQSAPQPDEQKVAPPEPEAAVPAENILEKLRDRLIDPDGGFKTILEARKFMQDNGWTPVNQNIATKEAEEIIEHAIVLAARDIVKGGSKRGAEVVFDRLVGLYNRQPRLGSRTSASMAEQAYSTPVPLAYVASRLAGIDANTSVLEPTAGNGALLIEASPSKADANELNDTRAANLAAQGFSVSRDDAAEADFAGRGPYDAVIANPPFGAVRSGGTSTVFDIDGFRTTAIDHAIAFNALKAMKNKGRAVLIVGGVKGETREARSDNYNTSQKRKFYKRLYDNYNVVQHFTVSGDLYQKQGAAWPVDVIVIDGRGKSSLSLPAVSVPQVVASWDDLKGYLDEGSRRIPEQAGTEVSAPGGTGARPAGGDRARGAATGSSRPAGKPARPESEPKASGVRPDRGQPEPAGDLDGGTRLGNVEGGRDARGADNRAPAKPRESYLSSGANASGQVPYRPYSREGRSLNTLVPAALGAAMDASLAAVEKSHGDIDAYVADALGYDLSELKDVFSAEQIDAIALAIDNVAKGDAFIIGDQTGIGKGRVVAAAIRFAHRQGMVPVFVTEKPDLYGDMFRDLNDIQWSKALGREPQIFMTNANTTVPLDDEAVEWVMERDEAKAAGQKQPPRRGRFTTAQSIKAAESRMRDILEGNFKPDVVFTTYDQMNSVKSEETSRRRFMDQLAPRAFIILDESHNAGGQGEAATQRRKKGAPPPRSQKFREWVGRARAVMYSSATYAKNPTVMDLYSRTDMAKAVEQPKDLPELIAKGKVPLQQVVASMLADAGQYARRERSFDGVEYGLHVAAVDKESYGAFADAIRAIFEFDRAISDFRKDWIETWLKENGAGLAMDSGVGDIAANSTEFASIMHNIVNQMLLAIKADAAADHAIASLENGEKPVIALSFTSESFITDYAEALDIKIGDEINISFSDVVKRYLERTRRITIKESDDTKRHIMIPVDELGEFKGMYHDAMRAVEDADLSFPVSPIDWMRHRITKAGFKVAEVTGRATMIDYSDDGTMRYVSRPSTERGASGKRVTIKKFNDGALDAVILNKSGSTGVSMHASEKFKDRRRRRMILAQADPNIDTHMQMLGRVHRTGQVIPPAYTQLAADIPAEARPTAVLMKKMASLNANTTASRKSAFSTAEAVDFMNEYGDLAAVQWARDHQELNARLGAPIQFSDKDDVATENPMQKLTGRIMLLPPDGQQDLLDELTANYNAILAQKEAMGENALEAKALDLQAEPVSKIEIKPATGTSPFEAAANMEVMRVKSPGRAMPPRDVVEKVIRRLNFKPSSDDFATALRQAADRGRQIARDTFSRVQAEHNEYVKLVVSGVKSPGARTKAEDQFQRWRDILFTVPIGTLVNISTAGAIDADTMPAIVLDITRSDKKVQSPTAASAWSVTLALPDTARQLTIPFSQVTTLRTQEDGASGIMISPAGWADKLENVEKLFDAASREGKEERVIATGNILAAYDQLSGKGQIIQFTDVNGATRPGILMPRGFTVEEFQKERRISLQTAGQTMRFLDESRIGQVTTRDDVITIAKTDDGYEFSMPASRAKGGRYFTDDTVRAIYDDWLKRGGNMQATVDRRTAERLIGAMQQIGARFVAPDEADLAQSIVYPKGVATPPPGPSATQPRPSAIIRTTPQDAWRPTDDYRPDPGKSQFANARDFVVEQGKIDDVEHMLFFSAEGELLVEGKGEKSRINFAPEVVDALNDPSQNLVMHHNHPGSRSLSVDDLLTLTYPGAEVVHAHGHNGAHYEARLADRLKPYRIPRTKIKPALTAMVQEAVETADRILQPQLQRLINAGQLSVDEAEIIHAHIVNLALADAGLITYASNRTDVSLDDARWSGAVQDAISDVRQKIEEFEKNAEQDLHAVRRSPEPVLREPGAGTGGVEGVSEGDQGAPRYDPQQGGRGGERRQTNRLLEGPSSPFQIAARVARLAPSLSAVRASLGRSIMRGIKRRPDDQETIGAYAHRLMIDYLDPVKQMVESVGGTVQDTMNAYLLARLAEDATLARIQGLHDQFVTPAVEALAKVGATLEDLHDFLYARHAPERNRVVGLRNAKDSDFYAAVTDHDVVGASGWSTNEAKRVLRDLAKDPEKFAGIREAARLIRQMLDKTLADQLAAGLISQETYDELTTQWKHYVPLKADDGLDSRGDFAPHRGRGFDVRGDEFKGATGRFTEAENIVAWAVSQSERAVLRAEHNNVGKAVLRFINHFDPGGDFLAKVYWTGKDELGDIEKAPTVYRREIGRDGMVHNRKVPPSTIAPDMFAAKVGGKTFYVKFADERVGLALKKMNAADLNFLFRLARKWTNFQSLINTRANPAFVPINIIRDAMTGAIHLLDEGFSAKEAAKIVAQIPRAWGALWRHMRGEPGTGKWDEALKEYIAAGGKITFEPHKTLEDSIKELQKRMAEAVNGKSRPKAIWDAFVKFVGDINDAGENGMRLAAYAAAREKGRTAKQAAFMARDLTVDFKKHGEAGPAFNSFYVFFNASIQGNYNIAARLVKSKTVRRAVYLIALQGILVDFLNRALSGDDDDGESYYEKMLRNEPWKFERQMVIFTGPGADDYFSVPLPYGYNAIYHMGLQAAAAGHGTVEPMEAIANAARVTFDAFNPIGTGGTMWNLIMPTALDPFIEITANRSFTGAPISPTRYPGDISPDSQRYFQSTPDWARDLAGWMNAATGGNEIEPGLVDIAPDTIEHMWGYVSGGIGRFFGQVVDTGKRLATGDEIEPENVPWVRSFYGRFDDDGKRAEYYRMREEVQIAKERLKDYAESGDREATSAFIERNRVAIDSIKVFDQIEKRLRKIRKAKRAIDFDKDLTRAQKDLRLKPLEEAEITHMNAARQAYTRNRRAQQ